MSQNESQMLMGIAYDLIEFSEGDLSIKQTRKFFSVRDYNMNRDEQQKVFLIAYQIICTNEKD